MALLAVLALAHPLVEGGNRETRIRGNLGQPRAIGRDIDIEVRPRGCVRWADCACSGTVRVESIDKRFDGGWHHDDSIDGKCDVVFASTVAIVEGICCSCGDRRRGYAKSWREHPSAGAYQILSLQRAQVAVCAGGEPRAHGKQCHGEDRAQTDHPKCLAVPCHRTLLPAGLRVDSKTG